MIKKEARILGLSAIRSRRVETFVVAAIFRGSCWLDGVLSCTVNGQTKRTVLELSRAITKSKQHSQLHAAIISNNQNLLRARDIAALAHKLGLPVIMLLKRAPRKTVRRNGVKRCDLRVDDVCVPVLLKGISFQKAEELLRVGCAPGFHIPEAVRVADLIEKQVTLKWHSLGLP